MIHLIFLNDKSFSCRIWKMFIVKNKMHYILSLHCHCGLKATWLVDYVTADYPVIVIKPVCNSIANRCNFALTFQKSITSRCMPPMEIENLGAKKKNLQWLFLMVAPKIYMQSYRLARSVHLADVQATAILLSMKKRAQKQRWPNNPLWQLSNGSLLTFLIHLFIGFQHWQIMHVSTDM